MLKPIFRAHPFLLVCGARNALATLGAVGFRSFAPVLNQTAVITPPPLQSASGSTSEPRPGTQHVTQQAKVTCASSHNRRVLAEEVARLSALPHDAWATARAAAAFNQHHLVCSSGLGARLLKMHKSVLTFAASLSAHCAQHGCATLPTASVPTASVPMASVPAASVPTPLSGASGGKDLRRRGEVGGEVGGRVRGEVRGEVRGDVRGGVRGEVRGDVRGGVRGEALSEAWKVVGSSTDEAASALAASNYERTRRARTTAGRGTFTGCWSPDGRMFASAGGGITVYETSGWSVLQRLPHDGHVLTGCFSRDSTTFSTGRGHNKVRSGDEEVVVNLVNCMGTTGLLGGPWAQRGVPQAWAPFSRGVP